MTQDLFNVKKSEIISLTRKIIKDKDAREKVILYVSAVVNYFFVIFQLCGGIMYRSVWFASLGVYYAVITSVSLYIGLSRKKQGREAWRVFRASGWVLALANLALVVMISVMIASPGVAIHNYSPVMAVGVTIWTFYLLISAVTGIVKHWREKNAVALAENNVQLIGAVVSVLMLQTAMIASYGTQVIEEIRHALVQMGETVSVSAEIEKVAGEMIQVFITSNRVTGALVIMAVLTITIYMILKGDREYKKLHK